jgi:hypothetical protein
MAGLILLMAIIPWFVTIGVPAGKQILEIMLVKVSNE